MPFSLSVSSVLTFVSIEKQTNKQSKKKKKKNGIDKATNTFNGNPNRLHYAICYCNDLFFTRWILPQKHGPIHLFNISHLHNHFDFLFSFKPHWGFCLVTSWSIHSSFLCSYLCSSSWSIFPISHMLFWFEFILSSLLDRTLIVVVRYINFELIDVT